jgi:hypothetical protein
MYLQDYGGPVGFRVGIADPKRAQALIIQNAVRVAVKTGAILRRSSP